MLIMIEMEAELRKLVAMRDQAVGVTEKRINCDIAELQNRIDQMKE